MRTVNLKKQYTCFPFCDGVLNAPMELTRIHNPLPELAIVEIEDTRIRLGIPPGGSRYCVFCEMEFVIALPEVICREDRASVRSGKRVYSFFQDRSYAPCPKETDVPVQTGLLTLHSNGNVEYGGYTFRGSELGNPVVYVRDEIGIDAEGFLIGKKPDRFAPEQDRRFLTAVGAGHFGILADRSVCHTLADLHWDTEPAIDLCACYDTELILGKSGTVYASYKNTNWSPWEEEPEHSLPRYLWKPLGRDVVSIAAGGRTAALGFGNAVEIYQYDEEEHTMVHRTTIPTRQTVSEVGVSDENLLIKYLEDGYSFFNWHNGAREASSCGVDLFPPKRK